MTHTISPAPPASAAQRSAARRNLAGTGVGNALEWFDWSIYSTFAPFFAASFFDATDPVSAFLSTLVVFAVGFVARPIGGALFGRLSDRIGRKRTLSLTMVTIAAASLVIGITPSYETIGVAASIILVVARLAQGLAYGGEQPAAGAFLSEQAPPERRGLWSSLVYFSGTIGAASGMALGAILAAAFGTEALGTWAWRIPFIVAGCSGLFALYMRSRMTETEQFTATLEVPVAAAGGSSAGRGLWRDFWRMRRSALTVMGMGVGLTVAYYFWVVAAAAFSIAVLGADATQVLFASLLANLVFIAVLPLWGRLSDRIGRRPVQLIGILGTLVSILPLSQLIDGDPVHLFAAMTVAGVLLAAPCAVSPAVMAELFPTRVRTAGVAIPLAVTTAVFGGTSLYLQTWMATAIGPNAFAIYVMVLLTISAVTVLLMPETKGRILTDNERDFQARP